MHLRRQFSTYILCCILCFLFFTSEVQCARDKGVAKKSSTYDTVLMGLESIATGFFDILRGVAPGLADLVSDIATSVASRKPKH
ncbi:hypothetical protein HNY73_018798 [Argiope bruennichi]|uniref:Uncharacterized protein n=1 Tax=Argiope bruennichi TaxID=94029 RepID=A0A8T0EHG7_ARGBR|nr:hypothetical protein HNY73_018798 [Argiope bruennichi]